MNRNLKIKIVALVTAFSAPALGVCHAMQEEAINAIQPSVPLVEAAQPYQAGAFGAVKSAQPQISAQELSQLPPIVPASSATLKANSTSQLPPIVSSAQAQQSQSPIHPATFDSRAQLAQTPTQESKSSNMLAPIAVNDGGPVVAQATAAPVDSSKDGFVTPVAQWQQSQNRVPANLANGVSSAGVPLYSPAMMNAQDSDSILDEPINAAPEITSDSQIITPIEDSSGTPGNGQAITTEQPLSAYDYQGQSPTYFDDTTGTPFYGDYGGCSTCGGAGCSACGPQGAQGAPGQGLDDNPIGPGLDFGDYRENDFNGQFDVFGSVANAQTYLTLDLQYIGRPDGDIVLTSFGALGDWDEDYGARVTIGRRQDATRGREISYFGTNKLVGQSLVLSPEGNLNPLFIEDPLFTGDETSPFFNSVEYFQRKESYFHSVEFNRVKWGWDVVKSFVGIRGIYFDDTYGLFSENIDGDTGSISLEAQNFLIGPHIGREFFYDVGYRWSFSAFFKGGVYVNVNEFDIFAANNGTPFIDSQSTGTTLAYSLEGGLMTHYEITRRARFRFGYNIIWFGNVSTVADNLPIIVSPLSGENISDSDDATFQGIFVGFELFN